MIYQRTFEKYEDYVHLQGSKARRLHDVLMGHRQKDIISFSKVFQGFRKHCERAPFLCLGARSGAENLAASLNGFPGSVGIDLHPVSKDVIKADWHQLPFPDKSFKNVYTNSIDHCLYLDKFGKEVHRVLTGDGVFIMHIPDKEGWVGIPILDRVKGFESLFWERSFEVCEALEPFGFTWEWISRHGATSTYILRKKKNVLSN